MDLLRIKELLSEKGMTGKELAAEVGVSNVAISNITSGNSFPKPDLLLKIAETLDVDIKELFYSTKEDLKRSIFIEKDGKYIKVGEIKTDDLDFRSNE